MFVFFLLPLLLLLLLLLLMMMMAMVVVALLSFIRRALFVRTLLSISTNRLKMLHAFTRTILDLCSSTDPIHLLMFIYFLFYDASLTLFFSVSICSIDSLVCPSLAHYHRSHSPSYSPFCSIFRGFCFDHFIFCCCDSILFHNLAPKPIFSM